MFPLRAVVIRSSSRFSPAKAQAVTLDTGSSIFSSNWPLRSKSKRLQIEVDSLRNQSIDDDIEISDDFIEEEDE